MADFGRMLTQLRAEHRRASKEIKRLDEAIAVFEKLVPVGATRKNSKGTRKVSAATRRKMAKAQKARWAKLRRQETAKS